MGSNNTTGEGVESPMSFERGLHISVNTDSTVKKPRGFFGGSDERYASAATGKWQLVMAITVRFIKLCKILRICCPTVISRHLWCFSDWVIESFLTVCGWREQKLNVYGYRQGWISISNSTEKMPNPMNHVLSLTDTHTHTHLFMRTHTHTLVHAHTHTHTLFFNLNLSHFTSY